MDQCDYEPQGIRFSHLSNPEREMLFVTDDEPRESLRGWICFRHPDGQWVTLRKANDAERFAIITAGLDEA